MHQGRRSKVRSGRGKKHAHRRPRPPRAAPPTPRGPALPHRRARPLAAARGGRPNAAALLTLRALRARPAVPPHVGQRPRRPGRRSAEAGPQPGRPVVCALPRTAGRGPRPRDGLCDLEPRPRLPDSFPSARRAPARVGSGCTAGGTVMTMGFQKRRPAPSSQAASPGHSEEATEPGCDPKSVWVLSLDPCSVQDPASAGGSSCF